MVDFIADTFSAADGTDLATHSPGTGGAWTDTVGAALIYSNAATMANFAQGGAINAATPPGPDYDVAADVIVTTPGWGNINRLGGRATSVGGAQITTGYSAAWNDGASQWELSKWSGGSETSLGTSAATFTAGTHRLTLSMNGSTIALLVDGTPLISVTDTTYSLAGSVLIGMSFGVQSGVAFDNLQASTGGAPPGTHVLTGRGSVAITSPLWLSTVVTGRPSNLSSGQAEPPNWYHVGMIAWGTTNGAMLAYPVTRDTDLVQLPSGMDTLWYEFASGVTATIVELSTP